MSDLITWHINYFCIHLLNQIANYVCTNIIANCSKWKSFADFILVTVT